MAAVSITQPLARACVRMPAARGMGCGLPFAPLPARPALRLRRAGGRSCVRASAHLDADSGVALAEAARHAHAALAPLLQLADGSVDAAVDAAAAAPRTGFLNGIANVLESLLSGIDDGLAKAGVPYSYGFSIIVLTLLVKAATFPLSKKQIDSTTAIQQLQPRVKELQARYANDTERLQLETARLYREANVNPLAGCLPTLATLPVFIGLYRALSNAATDGLLTDGFFWIPSLGGPVSVSAGQSGGGLTWLFPLVDGAPPVGWHDAIAYLVLPVALVISQFASQQIMQPQQQSTDPSQQQTQAILKFLPLMIGWFSLNVPSGLTLYWIVNNVITTGQTVFLRKLALANPVGVPADSPAPPTPLPAAPAPPRPSGPKPGSRFAQLKAEEQKRKGTTGGAPSLDGSVEGGDGDSEDGDAGRNGGKNGGRQRRGNGPKGVKWVEKEGEKV